MSKKLTKTLTSALTSIASGLQTSRKTKPQRRFQRRRRSFNYRPKTVNSTLARALPAAYASHIRPRFRIESRGINSVRVSGCDLVYPISDVIVSSEESIFAVIPANPAFWSGTKIGQFAPAYMNYRPLALTFSYIPQVAVTQAGTVFMGTLWNGAPSTDDIQQSLFTSNGGMLTQCFVPCDTTVELGTNLPQNLFTLAGSFSPHTNPFIFVAGVRPATVVPGYFYVTYTYEFKNPIGTSWKFYRSPTVRISDVTPRSSDDNTSIVVLNRPLINEGATEVRSAIPVGTVLDVESDGVYYNGTPVTLPSATRVIYYSCSNTFETDSPLAGSLDTLVVSKELDYSAPLVKVPLATLQSVETDTRITPITKDGVTYDKAFMLIRTNEGVMTSYVDIGDGLDVKARSKLAYVHTTKSVKDGMWSRAWDFTKKKIKAAGMSALGLVAATFVGPVASWVTERLYSNKFWAQANPTPKLINLDNPNPDDVYEDPYARAQYLAATSELTRSATPTPASSSSSVSGQDQE